MKHYTSYCLVVLSFLVSSCSKDFLERPPLGAISEGTLNTPDGVEMLCTSAYGGLHSTNADQWFYTWQTGGALDWLYSDVRSDVAYKGGGGISDQPEFHAMEVFEGVYAQHGHINGKWFNLYCAVQRANSAMVVLKQMNKKDYPLRDVRIGEMKFLRSYFFFDLQNIFNRIPYFDENTEIGDYASISNRQYTREEILDKIAADLGEAAELLPEHQNEIGRANKYSAYALQAKVLLYRAYEHNDSYDVTKVNTEILEEVVRLCDKLEGHYSLLPDFQDLDLIEFDNGDESVFEIQFSQDDGTVLHRTSWMYALASPVGSKYAGCCFFIPSQSLANSYRTNADGLPCFDDFNDVQILTVADGKNNNVDPRLDYVIGRVGVRWKTYQEEPFNESWCRDTGTYGTFCCKRHLISPEDPRMWELGMSDLNWKIIRYADVLLWKAEALIELGRQNEALELINQIRRRAKNSTYVKDWSDPSQPAAKYKIEEYKPGSNCVWTKEYARKALRFERKLEFAMEGDRFFDLVRWGVAGDVMNAFFDYERSVRPYMGEASFKHGKDEYLPIPAPQIELSHGIYKQNPYYND